METREELIEKAGRLAELTLDVLAHNLRKAEPHLSKEQAFTKVYTDPANIELRRAERTANGFRDYSKREPDDISEAGQIDFTKDEAKQWAFNELQRQAIELNKREPSLTHEQCFAKIYAALGNIELRKAEREANGFVKYEKAYPPVARTEPLVEQSMAMEGLNRLVEELQRTNPFLTFAQAFARIYADPANREHVKAERDAAYQRMFNPGVRDMSDYA